MKRIRIPMTMAAVVFAVAFSFANTRAQSEVAQAFDLESGWNAAFLEVQPMDRRPATVFDPPSEDNPDSQGGLENLESAWTWLSKETTAEFIQDPSEELYGQPGWLAHFAPGTAGFLTNLHAVLGNQAYLLKMSDAETWEVTGPPAMRKIRWVADSFNLVGFHLDPQNPPTFAAFFAPSAAHAGQAVYRLNNETGKWEFVQDPASAVMRSGEAYWVYCNGSSTYQGPLKLDLPVSSGLHYGAGLTRQTITLTNLSSVTRTVTLALSGTVVLYYREYDPQEGYFTWRPLGQMPPIAVQPESARNVWLEVRREQMAVGLSDGLLQIADDRGIRIRAPVSAERVQ